MFIEYTIRPLIFSSLLPTLFMDRLLSYVTGMAYRRRLETHYRHMQYIKGGSFLHIFALLLTAFQDAYDIYQVFSSGSHPALWRALPVFEQLLSAWENKQKSSRFVF